MADDADLIHELPSIAVAVDQLDWAIRLLADHDALIAAYSLAAIAEEMLGKRVQENALAQMRREFPGHDFNKLRNFLKHGTLNGQPVEAVDVAGMRQEVALMILRACENLRLYDSTAVSEILRFREWMRRSLPALFEQVEGGQASG